MIWAPFVYNHEDWQIEILNKLMIVMIEKLNTKSEYRILFQSWAIKNNMDCNYTKTKFVVFEKRSLKHPSIVVRDHIIYFCESYKHLGIHLDKKLNFDEHNNLVTAELAQHSGILPNQDQRWTKRIITTFR